MRGTDRGLCAIVTQHILTYSTLIALIWLLVKSHGSDREEERKPVEVITRARRRKKGERQSKRSRNRAALLIDGRYS